MPSQFVFKAFNLQRGVFSCARRAGNIWRGPGVLPPG